MGRSAFVAKIVLVGILALSAFCGCSGSSSVTGEVPAIPTGSNVVTMSVSSGQYSDVIFTHKTHSEAYMNNDCLTCHSHTGIRDTTIWSCSSCHSRRDPEGFCPDDAEGHGCWMVQCKNCHEKMGVGPTTACEGCHSTVNLGVFVDGPVENLFYTTATKKGFTDAGGTFRYSPAESSISFYLGDIFLGSGTPKPVMTPVDLVPGAVDETNQRVANVARFLQTLDADGTHSNGIQIPLAAMNYVNGRSIDFGRQDDAVFANDAGLVAFLSDLNAHSVFPSGARSLADPSVARNNLFLTLRQFHTPPVAGSVAMTGTLAVNLAVTGTYSYSDTEGDPEIGSTFRWYRDDNPSVQGDEAVIPGATSKTYNATAADEGKHLVFEVTPADRYHAGSPSWSASAGPVTFDPSNSAPTASNCAIGGPRDIGGNLLVNSHFGYTGSYVYNDVNGDPEGNSVYEWYLDADTNTGNGNETVAGSGSRIYSPSASDAGKYLFFAVSPRASAGNPAGLPCKTAAAGPITSANSATVYKTLASDTAVDKYVIRLNQPMGVVVDVQSYEGWSLGGLSHHFSEGSCYTCHSDYGHTDAGGPFNLGFNTGGSNNGDSNDILTINIFLFRAGNLTDVNSYVFIARKDGRDPGLDAPGVHGAPGVDENSVLRSSRNPYMDLTGSCTNAQFMNRLVCTTAYCDSPFYKTQQDCQNVGLTWHPASNWVPSSLPVGDYVLSVGAAFLDENGARSGSNGGGDNSGWTDIGDRSSGSIVGNEPSPAYRNYKILFTFQ